MPGILGCGFPGGPVRCTDKEQGVRLCRYQRTGWISLNHHREIVLPLFTGVRGALPEQRSERGYSESSSPICRVG